ncbi:unnamed protein product, partial [Gulo gulo]
ESEQAPAPPKVKAKVSKAKKAVLKGIWNHKKKKRRRRRRRKRKKNAPRRNKFVYYAIVSLPLTTESAMKQIEDNSTLCSLWMSGPISTKSNRLRRSSTTLRWPRSTS